MVADFIAAGRPRASELSWQARREGYLASAALGARGRWAASRVARRTLRHPPLSARRSRRLPLSGTHHFHGGCFVSGDFETHDRQMRMLCNRAGALVFAVHTRLAPDTPIRRPMTMTLAATLAIMAEPPQWRGDPKRIALAGDSAGGHLALITMLRLKEAGAPLPAAQILLYPMLDALGKRCYRLLGDDYSSPRHAAQRPGLSGHLARPSSGGEPVAPPGLPGLPPTHIVTAEFDPLRDEGEALIANCCKPASIATCQRLRGHPRLLFNWPPSVPPPASSSSRWPHCSGGSGLARAGQRGAASLFESWRVERV